MTVEESSYFPLESPPIMLMTLDLLESNCLAFILAKGCS